jgi:endonuclease/exonuclease/phosphatase family metal-dependent hydrolase
LARDSRAHFVILGDFNEDPEKVLKHLKNIRNPNVLVSITSVGSNVPHFPARGTLRALDSFFVTKEVHDLVCPS